MFTLNLFSVLFVLQMVVKNVNCELINFLRKGGIPLLPNISVANHNTELINEILLDLHDGDIFIVPNETFYFNGGIYGAKFSNIEFRIDGTMAFIDDRDAWPVDAYGAVVPCIYFEYISNVKFTSSEHGIINGNGRKWWGAINFLKHQEDRPRLFHMNNTSNILVENLMFKDSPYWTFYAENSDGLVVRYSEVDARWDDKERHTLLDLQAFNTDGFDVTGKITEPSL
jgi:hypothetical protein